MLTKGVPPASDESSWSWCPGAGSQGSLGCRGDHSCSHVTPAHVRRHPTTMNTPFISGVPFSVTYTHMNTPMFQHAMSQSSVRCTYPCWPGTEEQSPAGYSFCILNIIYNMHTGIL